MDEVGKLVRIANEEHGGVVAHHVPVAVLGVELDRDAAHIATAQAEQIKTSFAKKHPGVFVPTKAMQTWQIPD